MRRKNERRKSTLLSSHQKKKTSERSNTRETSPPQNTKNRDLLLIRKRHIKFLCERQRYATRGLCATYIYQVLSLCVCVSLSRSRARIHGVFFIPSFCALLFPTMMICFGLVVLFFKAMMVFSLFSFQKG